MDIVLNLENQERDLIIACINKEKWAQRQLYEQYYSSMLSICLRYSNNKEDALDILHESFIKVFNNIHKFKIGTSLPSWIKRVFVNTAIDFYRKNVRRRTEDIDDLHQVTSHDVDAVSKMSEQEILDVVQKLSPAYRTVFNLYVVEGFSHREIGEKLGITESTSRSNLVKARVKLKNLLKR